jgi:hypothetical protein
VDEHQRFILEKLRFGLTNKPTPEPMTDEDLERLNLCADDNIRVPQDEWNEWSRKTHWGLQYAFIEDVEKLENLEKLEEWRKHFFSALENAFEKDPEDRIVLDTLTLHFVNEDLLGHLIRIHGTKNLTDVEKKFLSMFSGAARVGSGKGCLGMILLVFASSMTLIVGVFLFLIY